MGILRDILDIVKDIGSIGSVENVFKSKRYSSLSKRSLEGTLQFPVLVSKSMDIETLQMVSKALERQYASFVQISLTMSPALDIDKDKNAVGYLKRFHQNTNVKTDMKDVFNLANDVLESYNVFADEGGNKLLFAAIYEGSTAKIIAANKDQLSSVMEHVRQDVLNDRFVPERNIYRFLNENLSAHHNGIPVLEAPTSQNLRQARNTLRTAGIVDDRDAYRLARDSELDTRQRQQDRLNNAREEEKLGLSYDKQDLEERKFAHQQQQDAIRNRPKLKDMDVTIVPQNILKDNDVKKSNELVPITMHVRTILINENNEQQGFMDFIIGIKATMHPIASEEMVTNMVNACKNNNKFFNFIRWTSGEINFFKDFLFNIQQIKTDVLERSAGASPWWITLKRRRALANLKDKLWMGNSILPNTSIVVSMEEVAFIKSEYGFDLMDPTFVDKIMKEYFLISFVVIDNSSQIAHFLFDGQSSYQSTTFSALERENSNKANDFKEMLKLINRV